MATPQPQTQGRRGNGQRGRTSTRGGGRPNARSAYGGGGATANGSVAPSNGGRWEDGDGGANGERTEAGGNRGRNSRNNRGRGRGGRNQSRAQGNGHEPYGEGEADGVNGAKPERWRSAIGQQDLDPELVKMSAAELAKQAKGLASTLNSMLKEKMPWEAEVERIRFQIRSRYYIILMHNPTSPAAQSIEQLWIFTSHILIAAYRVLIASYEKSVQEFTAQRASQSADRRRGGRGKANTGGRGGKNGSDAGEPTGPGPVEMRKLLSRFKQFLGNEKRFYRDLIVDVVEAFGLRGEVEEYLEALEIRLKHEEGQDAAAAAATSGSGEDDSQVLPPKTRPSPDDNERKRGSTPTGRRTPVPVGQSSNPPRVDLTREEIAKKKGIVHKALVCLGDLERYREQYGPERERKNGPPNRSKPAKADDENGGERYGGAIKYYNLARGLEPDNGNPSNQLAVISSYCQDTFSAIYHYFRALTVPQPFQTAEYNLAKTLRKALHDWEVMRASGEMGAPDSARESPASPDANVLRSFGEMVWGNEVGSLKREEVVLHAILYTQDDTARLPPLVESHFDHVEQLLKDRKIPSEIIVKMIALAIMAHWHARMHHVQDTIGTMTPNSETITVEYLLGIAGVLFDVAIQELESEMGPEGIAEYQDDGLVGPVVPVFDDEEEAMAQHISAVIRRMLPSLRIFSKWLKSNQEQVKTLLEVEAVSSIEQATTVRETVRGFWQAYFDFLGRLEWLFPIERLPRLSDPLEEDIDMKGMSPLSRGMFSDCQAGVNGNGDTLERGRKRLMSEVHPNEEQLMRISDLLIDGKMLLQADTARAMPHGRFARRVYAAHAEALDPAGKTPPARPPPSLPDEAFQYTRQLLMVPLEREADMQSVSTETEDDPVNLAMRATMLDGSSLADDEERSNLDDSEDEEEKVIWNTSKNAFGAVQQQQQQQHQQLQPSPNAAFAQPGSRTPPAPASRAPVGGPPGFSVPAPPTNTAQALLAQLIAGAKKTAPPASSGFDGAARGTGQPSPPTKPHESGHRPSVVASANNNMLFGSPAPGGSIWANTILPSSSQDTTGRGPSPMGRESSVPGGSSAAPFRSSFSAATWGLPGLPQAGSPSMPGAPNAGWTGSGGSFGNGSRFGTPLMPSSGGSPAMAGMPSSQGVNGYPSAHDQAHQPQPHHQQMYHGYPSMGNEGLGMGRAAVGAGGVGGGGVVQGQMGAVPMPRNGPPSGLLPQHGHQVPPYGQPQQQQIHQAGGGPGAGVIGQGYSNQGGSPFGSGPMTGVGNGIYGGGIGG